VAKPTDVAGLRDSFAAELQTKVKTAARTRVGVRRSPSLVPAQLHRRARPVKEKIIAVGASTGGVEALKVFLMGIPADCPPMLVTQHMPPRFTDAFAQRLNRECPMAVSEAVHDEVVEPGHVYIAPGAHHLQLSRQGGHYRCVLSDDPPVSGHRPSVDVLFRSVARVAGDNAIGVILTGMGKDGADGLFDMRKAGAITFGQDEDSALIYGMPRVAFECGAVMHQYSLDKIAAAVMEACEPEAVARGVHAHHSHETTQPATERN
jgi:two-component system chemotaxis response regulator CheB